jgi:hypothetical protein
MEHIFDNRFYEGILCQALFLIAVLHFNSLLLPNAFSGNSAAAILIATKWPLESSSEHRQYCRSGLPPFVSYVDHYSLSAQGRSDLAGRFF